jgi:uncharacterized protein (TIGR02001 family)
MKKAIQLKSLLLSMAVAGAATMAIAPVAAQAGVSANAGFVSTYVFRGTLQTTDEKGTASAGLDYEHDSGLYVGTWGSSLDDSSNLEYDIYGGWGGEFSGVSLGLGATGYYYTDSVADSFEEVNMSVGYGPVSVAYDTGDTIKDGAANEWYTHMAITGTYEGFSGTYGLNDVDGTADDTKYLQLDYGFDIADTFEGSISYVKTMQDSTEDANYLILGLSKSFDIM